MNEILIFHFSYPPAAVAERLLREHCVGELTASKKVTNIGQLTFAWVVCTKYSDLPTIGNLLNLIQTDPDSIKDKKCFIMAGGSHSLASILASREEFPDNPNFQSMLCWVFGRFNIETDSNELKKFQLVSYITSSFILNFSVVFVFVGVQISRHHNLKSTPTKTTEAEVYKDMILTYMVRIIS